MLSLFIVVDRMRLGVEGGAVVVSQGVMPWGGSVLVDWQIRSSQMHVNGMQWRTQKRLGGLEFSQKCSS